MRRWFILLFALMFATTARAGTIAVVDFQRALLETEEGKAASERLETMLSSRREEIERMATELQEEYDDYKAREMIMSEEARAETEKALMEKQATLQQTQYRYESEFQETYYTMLSDIDEKMRTLTEQIAEEQGYALVLDRQAVPYFAGDTVDMTELLIRKYNESQQ